MKSVALISEHASPLAVTGGIDAGGQNIYVAHVARQLAALGYKVDVFTRRDDPLLPEIVEWTDGVHVIHVPAGPAAFIRKEELLPWMDDFAAYMTRFARRRHYDVMHANFFMSGLVALKIKQALGIPFVITFHALGRVRRLHQREADAFPIERIEIEEDVMAQADAIIAECPQDRADLADLYHAATGKIVVIPCGFDPQEIAPVDRAEARARLGLPTGAWIVLQLGWMVPRKGVDTVIRGVAALARDYNIRAELVIVGGESDQPLAEVTPEIGRLSDIARAEGVANQLRFTGRKRRWELKYYYSAADVFVTTPWYEPFGITPVEAMACGIPVIGARVGGIKSTVVDGKTGFLIDAHDHRSLARRLAHLHCNPDLCRLFGRRGERRVNSLYTWRRVAISIAALYEGLTGQIEIGTSRAKALTGGLV
jgi:D-inositol-3-phosphate glycosyltransferase